jgi:hypothetical protein
MHLVSRATICAIVGAGVLAVAGVGSAGPPSGQTTDWNKELAVYSLEYYGTYNSTRWKSTIGLTNAKDPYADFWDDMFVGCYTSHCAHVHSSHRQEADVTVDAMVNSYDGWDAVDFVFFFGHNTMIRPQFSHAFDLWRPITTGWPPLEQWQSAHLSDWSDWGTYAEPYSYHQNQTIMDASLSNPYVVFYAYNPFTSVLIGQDFVSGTWWHENTYDQVYPDNHYGQLGAETEWVIAHGCNAVTVALYEDGYPWDDIVSTPYAVNAWDKSWNKLHLVMGHYYSTYTSLEPDLNPFAADIKSGDGMRDAYFDAHTSGEINNPALGMPAALSTSDYSCCWWFMGFPICPTVGCSDSYMYDDTWLSQMSDSESQGYYTTSWKIYE